MDLEEMKKAITGKTKLVWLNNPNNPTGLVLPPEKVEGFVRGLLDGTWVVLDEAYGEFAPPGSLPGTKGLLEEGRNLVAIRTFSKAWGLAGARIGYALARPELVTVIDTVSEPFNANRTAIAGASAALREDGEAFRKALDAIVSERQRASCALAAGPPGAAVQHQLHLLHPSPGRVGGIPHAPGAGGHRPPCGGWGFPRSIRVTVGTAEENSFFLESLGQVLSERKGERE